MRRVAQKLRRSCAELRRIAQNCADDHRRLLRLEDVEVFVRELLEVVLVDAGMWGEMWGPMWGGGRVLDVLGRASILTW